jgi:hypothetical protein
LGWASARVTNPDIGAARGRVYLLRGNGIFFSRGFGVLCRRLRQRGIWAEDLRCVGDRWAVRHLLADQRRGRLHGPIVFAGHSCGGRYSLYAARQLQEAEIPVDLIVCLDVALPLLVPTNVKRAVSIYKGFRRLYPARPLRAASPSCTVVENIDLSAPGSPSGGAWLNHLNIVENHAVQELVLNQILRAVKGLWSSPRV